MNDWLNVFFHGNSCVTHSVTFFKESFALRQRDKDSHLGWASDQFYSFFLSRTCVSNEARQFSTNHKLLKAPQCPPPEQGAARQLPIQNASFLDSLGTD